LYTIAGVLDRKEKVGEQIFGFPIIATDDDLDAVKKKCDCFAVTVGQVKSADIRLKIYNRLKEIDADLPSIVASSAQVSSFATLGMGTMVFHKAIINAAAVVGENCIINSGALLEHDVVVGNHCHISTSAVVNGNVIISEGCFIGSNATLLQGLHIGGYAIVGAGSVVLEDVAGKTVVAGSPAKTIRHYE